MLQYEKSNLITSITQKLFTPYQMPNLCRYLRKDVYIVIMFLAANCHCSPEKN